MSDPFYTKDGDMKPPKVMGALARAGRSSQIAVSAEPQSHDAYQTTRARDTYQVATCRMEVAKYKPPNKNRASEPGVPWAASDYPIAETFKTVGNIRDAVISSGHVQPQRQNMKELSKSTVSLGYKEAESTAPYESTNVRELQNPQLGARRAGATAKDPPAWGRAPNQVNPITGLDREGAPSCIFERYNPDLPKSRVTNDYIYRQVWNKSACYLPYKPDQDTKYDQLSGKVVQRKEAAGSAEVKKFPRPHLNSLGAVRPPEGWNPVTQKIEEMTIMPKLPSVAPTMNTEPRKVRKKFTY